MTSAPYTRDAPQISLRLEPGLAEALDQLRRPGADSRAEMARLLIRRGLAAVAEEAGRPLAPPAEQLDRDAFVSLVHGLVLTLSTVLAAHEPHDPVATVLAARGVETAARGWADDRAASYGLGLAPAERLAQLVDSLTVLVRTAPPADRLPLWGQAIDAVSARSREDYAVLTGDKIGAQA